MHTKEQMKPIFSFIFIHLRCQEMIQFDYADDGLPAAIQLNKYQKCDNEKRQWKTKQKISQQREQA